MHLAVGCWLGGHPFQKWLRTHFIELGLGPRAKADLKTRIPVHLRASEELSIVCGFVCTSGRFLDPVGACEARCRSMPSDV